MKARTLIAAVAAAAWLFHPAGAFASHHHHVEAAADTTGMDHVHRDVHLKRGGIAALDIEFGAGHLVLRRGAPSHTVTLDLYRTVGLDTPRVTLDENSDQDRLRVDSGTWRHDAGARIHIRHHGKHDDEADDDDGDEDDHDAGTRDSSGDHATGGDSRAFDIDTDAHSVWEIALPSDVPFDINLTSGASSSRIDLTSVQVHNLEIETGAGEMDLSFDKPNPESDGTLEIHGGACRFAAYGLGNARFRSITFEGGVGDFFLDWSGDSRHRSDAEIELGLGKLRVELPASLGVKLDASGGALAHLDVDGLDRRGDTYESPGYAQADRRLTLQLSASLGLVDVAVR